MFNLPKKHFTYLFRIEKGAGYISPLNFFDKKFWVIKKAGMYFLGTDIISLFGEKATQSSCFALLNHHAGTQENTHITGCSICGHSQV
jgi:hypothetical protein